MKKRMFKIIAAIILSFSLNLALITVAAAAPTVIVESTTSIPAKVKVSSFSEFKKKLATAINLKKNTITIETTKYSSKEYDSNSIKKFIDDVNFEVCFSKGYSVAYSVTWTNSGNVAKYIYKFKYNDISKSIKSTNLLKVRNLAEFNKVIKDAVLKKKSILSVALGYTSNQKYNIDKAVSLANDKEILSNGYYAECKGYDSLNFSDSKIINIYLDYFDFKTGKTATTAISSYEMFYNTVKELLVDKQWKLAVSIENYSTESYNLGEVLLDLNKQLSSKYGYIAKATYRTLKLGDEAGAPAVLEVRFEYRYVKPGEYYLDEDKDRKILRNEKEWYQAIKTAITEDRKSIAYNITYSSDYGSTIDMVLDQNPDINYIKSYSSYSDGNIMFEYKFDKDRLSEMKTQVSTKAQEIITSLINPEMNQAQRAKAIHDYLVLNATYDFENYKGDTLPEESFTAYGVLINRTGVCQGYAAAFKLLANLAGIKCIGVTGDAGQPHAWNMAELDGVVGYIDVTWDDPVPDRGSIYYYYFNISESKMSVDHKWDKDNFNIKYLDY